MPTVKAEIIQSFSGQKKPEKAIKINLLGIKIQVGDQDSGGWITAHVKTAGDATRLNNLIKKYDATNSENNKYFHINLRLPRRQGVPTIRFEGNTDKVVSRKRERRNFTTSLWHVNAEVAPKRK